LKLEPAENLRCTPSGKVADAGSRTIFSFTRDKAEALVRRRRKLSLGELQAAVAKALRLPSREGVPDYRILRPVTGRKYPRPHCTSYALNTEGQIFAVLNRLSDAPHFSRPPQEPRRAVLYVAHLSSDAELRSEPLIAEVMSAECDADFWTCDVRGVGESLPDTCRPDSFFAPNGSDYFYAVHSLMLDRPYVGQKTFDLLRALDWLQGAGRRQVHLVARGWGAVPATFAALLSDVVTQVTLKNHLTSYHDLASSQYYRWPLSCFVPNVLEDFDLPDCYGELAAKQLRLIDASGPAAS
jgi:hypothetical protein